MNKTLHFIRHYLEMVVAMFAGMFVLGGGAVLLLGLDSNALFNDAPELALNGMALTMTIPMVGWMLYRGHSRRESWEMTASMFVPTFLALALMRAGVLEDGHAAMGIQHVLMFPAMAAVMLLRGSGEPHHRPAAQHAAQL